MYYRLKEPWTFRGWKKMPYALRAEYGEKKHERPLFMEKEPFMALLYCNGEEAPDGHEMGCFLSYHHAAWQHENGVDCKED